jgi:hypothetical protein
MTTNILDQDDAQQLLYHVSGTLIDFSQDPSGATQATDILKPLS